MPRAQWQRLRCIGLSTLCTQYGARTPSIGTRVRKHPLFGLSRPIPTTGHNSLRNCVFGCLHGISAALRFAFAGLADSWALSICLFCAKFGVRCVPSLMANSRPTPPHPNRTPAATYLVTPTLTDVFADPADMMMYGWVKERFEHERRDLNVTPERCAREVCPLLGWQPAAFMQQQPLSTAAVPDRRARRPRSHKH